MFGCRLKAGAEHAEHPNPLLSQPEPSLQGHRTAWWHPGDVVVFHWCPQVHPRAARWDVWGHREGCGGTLNVPQPAVCRSTAVPTPCASSPRTWNQGGNMGCPPGEGEKDLREDSIRVPCCEWLGQLIRAGRTFLLFPETKLGLKMKVHLLKRNKLKFPSCCSREQRFSLLYHCGAGLESAAV